MGLPSIKQWLDRYGSGTQYANENPPDSDGVEEGGTPVDAAGLRNLESRVSTAIDETAAEAVDAHAAAMPHPSVGEKAALAGSSGTPGDGNRFVTTAGEASALALKQSVSEKGQASGYASLGGSATVPPAQLATGTRDGTKLLRDDGTWQPPPAQSGSGVVPVTHGANASYTRPVTASPVWWFGSVQPNNMVAGDIWTDNS